MKKICNKCGKVIGYIERCNCREAKKRLVSQVQKTDKEDLIVKHKRKWEKLREEIIKRDDGFCQRCYYKYNILNDRRLEVHHIKSRKNYPKLTFDKKNLITICRTCNAQLGTKDELDFYWEIREDDDVIII
jgi:5-methylcytosine-specific restriction endonuclease McrA